MGNRSYSFKQEKTNNMGEIICVDAQFTQEVRERWKQFGVVGPEENSLYNVRELVNHTNGTSGFRLEEIKNPQIPVKHSILGTISIEPTFRVSRFRNIDGSEITKEQLKETIHEKFKETIHEKFKV
jgi:hypothetical protein